MQDSGWDVQRDSYEAPVPLFLGRGAHPLLHASCTKKYVRHEH